MDSPLYRLRLRMLTFQVGSVSVAALFLLLYGANAGGLRFVATGAAILASAYPGLVAWHFAPLNRSGDDGPPRRNVGPANYVTLARSVLIALLFGLVVLGIRDSRAVWLALTFYGVSLLGDLADGFIARRRGETSELGRHLENEVDSLGCLAASTVLVISGKLPWYFMAVGFARYLFVLAVWIRRRMGPATYDLKHSRSGRIMAGIAMNYMLVAMAPLVPTVFARRVMPIVIIPFLAGFARDFYGVSTGRALRERTR